MDLHGFITTVERVGNIPNDEEAERVACVTLQALSQRISVGEARDLAERLPDPLRTCVRPEDPPEKFHVEEFLRRIAEPLGLDRQVAEREASAVLTALFEAVGPEEFADMRSELPKDFGPLLDDAIAKAPSDEPDNAATMSYDEFLARVEERTMLESAAASKAVEAVLETLAYRIDGRMLDELERLLPRELWPVLERGRMRSGGEAVPFKLEEFLRQAQKLEALNATRDEVLRHARAVMQTLRDAVGKSLFRDLMRHLSEDYLLLAPPRIDEEEARQLRPPRPAIELPEFLATVMRTGELSDEDFAQRASCTTLRTLAKRISAGEAEDIAERLPDELRPCIEPDGAKEKFHANDFLAHVTAELQVVGTQTEQAIRGVLVALFKTVGPDEFADLRSELPKDFGPWLDRAIVDGGGEPNAEQGSSADGRPEPEPGMSYQQFLQAVAARGAHDDEHARMAAEAVLEVLATRVTGGQLDDLEPLLPRELWPALERGRARSGGRARPLTLQEFLREVQEREGVTRDIAFRHARAVMLTLREALGEKEFHDTLAQLPIEYRQLLRSD
jgi:uncharacterized protein (DUF2267 family)